MGNERINEIFDPEIAINRAIDYYRNRGYSDIGKKVISKHNSLKYKYIDSKKLLKGTF